MKHTMIATAAGIAAALFQTAAMARKVDAQWAKAEAKEHGCLNCHDIDKKKAGPAWQDSAAKFNGKSAADLSAAIKATPAHGNVLKKTSDKDLNLMAEWILTLGK